MLFIKNSIDFFLSSPGKQKILIIYGGEPLLFFELLRKVILYACQKSKYLKKETIISLGTNGILLKKEHLLFFNKHNVKIALSLDGNKTSHNSNRRDRKQKGSFDKIRKNFALITKNTKKQNLCVLFGIHPRNAKKMYKNFLFLLQNGFRSINIEPIQNILWQENDVRDYKRDLKKIIFHIVRNLERKNFIFLNSMNRILLDQKLHNSQKKQCPFYENLEIYPSGEMSFSPFLMNSTNKDRYVIGNIKDLSLGRYLKCSYNCFKQTCINCSVDYYPKANKQQTFDLVRIRNYYSLKCVELIKTQAVIRKVIYREYLQEAEKLIFE